jgi:hypothetical protein
MKRIRTSTINMDLVKHKFETYHDFDKWILKTKHKNWYICLSKDKQHRLFHKLRSSETIHYSRKNKDDKSDFSVKKFIYNIQKSNSFKPDKKKMRNLLIGELFND